ncbi:MAG TPA: universal stress protein [Gammaproteobacteria bacterium]
MAGLKTILVPVDFSVHASQALETATELAKTFKAKLHLLHCCQLNVGVNSAYGLMVPPSFDREIRDAAARRLAEWRDRVTAQKVEAETEISAASPTEAIASTAERIGADLIVIGTRGLSGIKHVMVGSVAERTVRNANCPVLTVKARGED